MNKISVYGRMTRDVELKDVNGRNAASFGVAAQNKRKKQDGSGYDTNFYNVTAWGQAADVASKYLKKGQRIAVSGDLIYREYVGSDGKNHGVLEINNAEFDLVETAREAGATAAQTPAAQAPAPAAAPAQQFTAVENLDDLPF